MCRLLLFAALLCLPVFAQAEAIFSAVSENDLYASGTDRYYTNGVRYSVMLTDQDAPQFAAELAELLPMVDKAERKGVVYSLGHNLYTPNDIANPAPDPDQRPYAAMLYVSAAFAAAPKNLKTLDEAEVMVGMVGPAALGEDVQSYVHRVVDSPQPQGWDYQLKNEPILNLFWQRRWPRQWVAELDSLRLSLTPHTGVALGNAYIYGSVGGGLSLSPKNSPLQDYPLRVRPSMPGTGYFAPVNKVSWSLFAGTEVRLVARDIFLDGNTFTDSPNVDKHPVVLDAQIGAAITYKKARLAYTAVYRTKEFHNQSSNSIFGALSLSFHF